MADAEDFENDQHEGERCVLKALSEAMYATVERRPGLEQVRAVILLDDPGTRTGTAASRCSGTRARTTRCSA